MAQVLPDDAVTPKDFTTVISEEKLNDDDRKKVTVSYINIKDVKQRVYENVWLAVREHRRLVQIGFVPPRDFLATLESYTSTDYSPTPGTIVEALDKRSYIWQPCVVANVYKTLLGVVACS